LRRITIWLNLVEPPCHHHLRLILLNVLIYALGIFTGPDIRPHVRPVASWLGRRVSFLAADHYSFCTARCCIWDSTWLPSGCLAPSWKNAGTICAICLTYLLSVAVAAMTQITVSGLFLHATGPVIGASGGVFGLLLAYALYFPNRVISIIFYPSSRFRTHLRARLRRA